MPNVICGSKLGCLIVTTFALASTGWANAAASPTRSVPGCVKRVVAAGDMNSFRYARATGAIAQTQNPDVVAVLGDQQYPNGSLSDYQRKYDKTWGALKARTQPVPGHHEYKTPGASGYFAYFGKPAYYAYDIGCGWRGYALNSLIAVAPQVAWLQRDLAAHPGVNVVASFSDPRYSSGIKHGGEPKMQPFWDALAGRKGVILNGHEHNYERFAPRGGLTEFVAGTGGSASYPFGAPIAGSVKRIAHTPGILDLALQSHGSYIWAFLNSGGTAVDIGRG